MTVKSLLTQRRGLVAAVALPPVVAKVNNVDITIMQFWSRLLAGAGNTVLTSLVDEILIEQEAEKAGILPQKDNKTAKGKGGRKTIKGKDAEVEVDIDRRLGELKKQFKDEAAFQKQLNDSGLDLETLKKQIRIEVLKEKLLGDKLKVAQNDVRKFFDDNRQQLAVPEQVRLSHILVASEQEAKDLALSLKVGANFDLLAKEKSQDAATKERGGELGFFSKGMLMPELEQKAFSLPVGGTDIVKTAMGFHVIKILEKKAAKAAAWDKEMESNIEKNMRQAKFNQEYPSFIQSLRSKANIQVFLNR